MSRIGKKAIALPANVKVNVKDRNVTVEAGSSKLTMTHRPEVKVRVDDQARAVIVEADDSDRTAKAMHGLTRALINNMVEGVTKGYSKELEIVGAGWSAKLQGMKIQLSVGYADTREVQIPAGVKVEVQANTKIKVSGADKQAVGQIAAPIRSHRPPEPYNGKGIKYIDEHIIRKAGKAFASGGGG